MVETARQVKIGFQVAGGRWQVVAGDVGRGGRRKSEGRGC